MSKSFKFNLEKIFKYKTDKEGLKAIDLKRSKDALEKEKQRLEKLHQKKYYCLGQKEAVVNDDIISLEKLKAAAEYLDQLNNKISSQDEKVKESNQEVEQRRNDLLEVSKERKILEKLRERHYQKHLEINKKENNKKESEIALRRRTRNNRAEGE